MGKPDPVIYNVALDMLKVPKELILAVGDSLQHDIKGGLLRSLPALCCMLLVPHFLTMRNCCHRCL